MSKRTPFERHGEVEHQLSETYTIDDLEAVVKKVLSDSNYQGQESARVSAYPNKRTIRFYITQSLLAPMKELRGRTALYDLQHVLQIALIKKLQSEGMKIADLKNQQIASMSSTAIREKLGLSQEYQPTVDTTSSPETKHAAKREKLITFEIARFHHGFVILIQGKVIPKDVAERIRASIEEILGEKNH